MSMKYCCSLCCTACSEYALLENDLGECNEIYEITVKYFDPMFITEYSSNENKVLCQDCWCHIKEFHEFQQTVLKMRVSLEDKADIKHFPFDVKQESEQYDITNYEDNDLEKSNESDQFEDVYFNKGENFDLKNEKISSCDDALELKSEKSNNIKRKINSVLEERNNIDEIPNDTSEMPNSRKRRKQKTTNKDSKSDGLGNEVINRAKKTMFKSFGNAREKSVSSFNLKKARESDAFIAEWKPELICDVCNESASNFDNLRNHFKKSHKTRFYIKCCERKFFRRCVLVNHIQLHLNPETHKCDICGKSSSTKHNLKLHKKVMHEDTKQLKCDVCYKLFKQKVTLDRHLLTHVTGSKDFICKECGKGYVAEQLLKLHIKHVHNVDRVCDQCGKTIHGIQALKKHLMEHDGIERPRFPCNICGLELKSPNGLKRHKASYHNDGSTIYVCSVCGKLAASENALLNHKKLVHVEERKYKCTYCNKAFKRPKSLREHIATHTGQDLYKCPHCPQTFKVSSNMHHHRKKVHPIEWEEGRKNRLQYPKVDLNQAKNQVVI